MKLRGIFVARPCLWARQAGAVDAASGGVTYLGHVVRYTRNLIRRLASREESLQQSAETHGVYLSGGGTQRAAAVSPASSGVIGRRLSQQAVGGTGIGKQSIVARLVSKWVSDSFAAELRRNTAKRLMFRGANGAVVPSFAFVGVCLGRKTEPTLLTEEEELETVCQEIRSVFARLFGKPAVTKSCAKQLESLGNTNAADVTKVTLKNLELGSALAKGCNAVVYSARLKNNSTPAPAKKDDEDAVNAEEKQDKENEAQTTASETASKFLSTQSQMAFPVGSIGEYDLAVKMMFNYDAESNAAAIWQAMYKESLPARHQQQLNGNSKRMKQKRNKRLPPHPNIIEMHCAFADWVPALPDAMSLYPDALPRRINQTGAGRNMTLFLVMKRYHCTLKEYLQHHQPTMHTSLLLLTQLLEGVTHLLRYGVAHRDLKTDNILVDLTHGVSNPVIAITDFGCCLADENVGLRMPFPVEDVFRGGNLALMAPEVVNAEPGPFSYIDYSRADTWAVGTMAYELFGAQNPFYTGDCPQLQSATYKEEDIPAFPPNVPKPIQLLVKRILHPNPYYRPSPSVAASVCQLLLHATPSQLYEFSVAKKHRKVIQWLLTFAASTLCQQNSLVKQGAKLGILEMQLRITFLRRVRLCDVLDALEYVRFD